MTYEYHRISNLSELPPIDRGAIDIALLDMNHTFPNIGHDSIVHKVREIAEELEPTLSEASLSVRLFSFDVRAHLVVPDPHDERFGLVLGTGGPGHLDPRLNDGKSYESQGIAEDPSWEKKLFALFDAILDSDSRRLLAVCHTFGVLCRWSGVATPELRGAEKGGKSSGVVTNFFTADGLDHPYFRSIAENSPDHRSIRVLDSRLFDLIPTGTLPAGAMIIGFEADRAGTGPGKGVTMIEFARGKSEVIPRMFAMNFHPEIRGRSQQLELIEEKYERGEVSEEWYLERRNSLKVDGPTARDIRFTAEKMFLDIIRAHVHSMIAERLAQTAAAR